MNVNNTEQSKRFQQDFEALPLDEKISALFKMEIATISEAMNYVVKEPMKAAEKIGEIITEFGKKVEEEIRCAVKKGDGDAAQEGKTRDKKARKGPAAEGTAEA